MTQQIFEHLSFDKPDEVREGDNWRLELVNLAGGAQVGRITIQPGWRWTEHVKPVAGTDLCTASHQQYQVSGRIHVVMEDRPRPSPARATSRRGRPATTPGSSVTSAPAWGLWETRTHGRDETPGRGPR